MVLINSLKKFEQEDDVVFSKKPSASDLEDEDISVEPDGDVLKFDLVKNQTLLVLMKLKVKLPNGKFATCYFRSC